MILATPPGFNPGMFATELALVAFLRRHGWSAQARCYRMVEPADRLRDVPPGERAALARRADAGVASLPALEHYASIVAADVVVFWADFLHMAQYVRALERVAAQHGLRDGERTPAQIVAKLFLLAEADDATLRRTISFGTNLLFNTLGDEADPAYAVPLRRLLALAKRVWVRDALSAARVAHLRGEYGQGHFGVDCAQLLTRDDVRAGAAAHGARAPAEPGAVLAFFGRDADGGGKMLELASRLAAAAGRPLRWLPWGDARAFPAALAASLAGPRDATGYELLDEVAHASLVVTDTYHLAAIAWSLGVPAVAAFAGHTTAEKDVSSGPAFHWRDKREVFFSQYDALDFLVRPEELADPARFARRAGRIAEAVRDRALCSTIVARIRAHAASIEAELAADMTGLLARGRSHGRSSRIRRLC